MVSCPNCHQTLNASAIVDGFNDPANWQFWGEPGQRWIVCQSSDYVHFRVRIDGRMYHRLARIRPAQEASQ